MRISAVILAGGAGRRIGGGKPLRPLAGKSLFDHVLDVVKGWDMPYAVSVRDRREAGFAAGLPLLPDEEGEGPIAGVASALRHAQREALDGVLTLPCDTPFLPNDLPRGLAAGLSHGSLAAIARSGGRLHPSCALWRVEAVGALPRYLPKGRSLIGFAEALDAKIANWSIEPYDPFFNVNTEEDLVEAERILRSR